MSTSRPGFTATLLAAAASALVLLLLELRALDAGPGSLSWVATALLIGGGLGVGLALWLIDLATARLPARLAPLVRGLGLAPPLGLLARRLFEGGFASTLPGARLAPLLLPLLGVLVAAALFAVAERIADRRHGGRLLAVACGAAALLLDAANRRLLRTQYPDVHLFLLLLSLLAGALALRLGWRGAPRPLPRRAAAPASLIAIALLLGAAGGVWLAVDRGLAAPADRLRLATRGTHTRELVRLLREWIDRDGDGASPAFHGPDCDDHDPAIHSRAVDLPETAADEDCDGLAPAPPTPAPPPAPAPAPPSTRVAALLERSREMNLLLVSVDALRADAVTDTVAHRRALPHFFALLDGAVRFAPAFATSSGTDYSLPSLVCGHSEPWSESETTLAEAMRRSGRSTSTALSSEVLRWAGETIFRRGCDHFARIVTDPAAKDVGSVSTAAETTGRGLEFLDRAGREGRRFFIWLHYFDAHEHHQLDWTAPALRPAAVGHDLAIRGGRYAAAVALVDRALGELLDGLAARGLDRSTVVALVSDHGESLGEDPRLPEAHGQFLYTPLVEVPLALRVPGVAAALVAGPVSISDLAPTLIALSGAPIPPRMNGRSLVPQLLGEPHPPGRVLVLRESDQQAIVRWPWKLLVRPGDNLVELFDLADDPNERRDLAATRPDLVAALRQALREAPTVVIDRGARARRQREEAARARARTPR